MDKLTLKTSNIKDKATKNTTCFAEHKSRCISCINHECRFWIDYPDHLNCTIIASAEKRHTLQEIGDLFGITRMRICQIEKGITQKLLKNKVIRKL